MAYITHRVLLISFLIISSSGLEPVTTGVAVGTAIVTSALFATYDKIYCQLFECCDDNWSRPNITALTEVLSNRLHGQHLVKDTVKRALQGHLNNANPAKALVLSFHGWTGGGKNFVSRFIAENLFKAGIKSKYVHIFVSPLHFPHNSRVETYKDQLREWVRGNVSACAHSLFIFDEVDKMPPGLLDAVKPYMDHYPEINGVDFRKSIFLLLSNTAGNAITKRTLENWENGITREDITLQSMEELITNHAFNEEGGLWHSDLIEKNMITAFVPFLPMERGHVKLCIKDDLKAKNQTVTEELLSQVADELQYFPAEHRLFSKSGCKRVSEKVDFVLEGL